VGYDLGFIAFNREPSVGGLQGLTKYRLFKRAGRAEWYLDGPNRGAELIPLFERPTIDERMLGETWANATREYSALVAETGRHGYGSHGLDYKLLPIAIALSAALDIRLLVVSGNDEDLDCGFICSNGQLLHGQFIVDEARALVFSRGSNARVVDLDWNDGHYLYGLMGAVAAEYFGDGDAISYANGWQELDRSEYVMISHRG